jgi:glycosyltransferase involved in cell wall biosynthesis
LTLLTNLLLFTPGHSGFSSYVRRVLPGIPGYRLLIDGPRGPLCRRGDDLPQSGPTSARLALLQRLSLSQHGVDVGEALSAANLSPKEITTVYSPYCDLLFALPAVPQVITCHDLTPLFYSNSRKATWRYRLWTPVHLRRADRVIAISEFVANQVRQLGVPTDRIRIVPNGIAGVGLARGTATGADLLMLARHDGNKNVIHALFGFARFLCAHPNWQGGLRIVGRAGRCSAKLRQAVRELALEERVWMVDAIDNLELERLLRKSLALISSSLMEGFNYPVLEAMAAGLPCLISEIPVHKELYTDAALFFKLEDDGEGFAQALTELIGETNTWKDLSARGIARAQIYSLARQRQGILEVINEASGNSGGARGLPS